MDGAKAGGGDEQHSVGVLECRLEFVGGVEDCFALHMGQVAEECGDFGAAYDVEKTGRLVEQNYGSLLGQGAGKHYAATFAVGDAVDFAVGEIEHADGLEGLVNNIVVGGRKSS